MLIGVVNFGTSLIGLLLLTYFGRRTIMLFGKISMIVSLIGLGISSLLNYNLASIVFVLSFVGFFEFADGPITWLYSSEIC